MPEAHPTSAGPPAPPPLDRRASRPYRGDDRRAATPATGSKTNLLVASGLLGGLLVAALLFRRPADAGVVDVQRTLLLALSTLVAGLTGVLCLLRLRVTGEAPVLWLGTALVVLALSRIGGLVDLAIDPGPSTWLAAAAYGAGTLLCPLLVAQALRSPPVDTRIRPVPVLLGAAVAMVVLTLGIRVAGVDDALSNLPDADGARRLLGLAVGFAWLTVAGQAIRRSRLDGGETLTWPALAALGLSLAALVPLLARAVGGDPTRASLLVETGALVCALLGIQSALVRTVGHQQTVLFDTAVEAATAVARQRAEQEAREERDHDLRSALFAIEGAARTLERHQAALDEGARHDLARAVASEVTRLQALVRTVDDGTEHVEFSVADVLGPLLAIELTAGVDLRLDIPEGLTAVGSPAATTEIIRNLLDNARNHAPGAAVCVAAEQRDGEIVLHVSDEGPGVPVGERSSIFERGRRGSRARVGGSGLGLFVSARLAASQGGRLELSSARTTVGSRFSLHLPTPSGVTQP